MTERSVLRLLRGSDAAEAAPLVLAARDKSAPAPVLEAASCPICLHLYGDSIAPRMMGCGHTFCDGCLDEMLRPLPACGGIKKLSCPKCRTECSVPKGRAAELPANFDIM